jgi:hypothetical protein
MIAKYTIQQPVSTPTHTIEKGENKTVGEWLEIFPTLKQDDFNDKSWWLPDPSSIVAPQKNNQ